jgi:hypothetical protein
MLNIVFGVTTCLVRTYLFRCFFGVFLIVFIVGYRVFLSRSIYLLTCVARVWVECFLDAFLLAFYLLHLLYFSSFLRPLPMIESTVYPEFRPVVDWMCTVFPYFQKIPSQPHVQ